MKRLTLLLVVLLFGLNAIAQQSYYYHLRSEYWGIGHPDSAGITPNYSNAVAIDTVNQKVYRYRKNQGGWFDDTNRWRGIFLEQGTQSLFAAQGLIYVHPNDSDDTQQLNNAFSLAATTGKPIWLAGHYKTTSTIFIDKYASFLVVYGNMAKIESIGGTGPVIGSLDPTDNGDANLMVNRQIIIRDLVLKGSLGQIGIDSGPSYGARYDNVRGENLETVIHVRFGLKTLIINGMATNCKNGWILDYGDWTNATASNSQSNHSQVISCRYYGNSAILRAIREEFGQCFSENIQNQYFEQITHPNAPEYRRKQPYSFIHDQVKDFVIANFRIPSGGVVVGIYASSGCRVEDLIGEGFSVGAVVDIDGHSSTVVKNATITNVHFECVNGATHGLLYVRLAGGIVKLDGAYSGYPGILVNSGSSPGYIQITVENIPWWVLQNGKAFVNNAATSWKLKDIDNLFPGQPTNANIISVFDGRPVNINCGYAIGYDTVCPEYINR